MTALKYARDILHDSETTLRYALWLSAAQLPVLLIVLWSRVFLCLACAVDLSIMIFMMCSITKWQDAKLLISLENLDHTLTYAQKVLERMEARESTRPTEFSASTPSSRPSPVSGA